MQKSITYTNDNNTTLLLFPHIFHSDIIRRNNHEIFFRRIHSYLIRNNLINGNIIDLGAWIGDNSLPWAKQIKNIVYAIDPSPNNINFIDEMARYNNINNIKTIQKAISDKNEVLGTNNNINMCSFVEGGSNKADAVSLDYLYENREIDNIAFIHLDVEGFEFKVIKGAEQIIKNYMPLISYEQHLTTENYMELSTYLHNKGYDIYLINEVLPGCFFDCRNLMAIPNDSPIDIADINLSIEIPLLLSIFNTNKSVPLNPLYTGTIFGKFIGDKVYENVKSVTISDNLYVFAILDDGYTKMVAVDSNLNWIHGKYLLGQINLDCQQNIKNAYFSAYGIIYNQSEYNIKNIIRVQ